MNTLCEYTEELHTHRLPQARFTAPGFNNTNSENMNLNFDCKLKHNGNGMERNDDMVTFDVRRELFLQAACNF